MIERVCLRFGLNYFWGIANFTAGSVLCGSYVATILVAHGAVR